MPHLDPSIPASQYDPNAPKSHYNLDTPVPESVIQQIRDLGMAESIKFAQSGQASPEFIEGVRRFYPDTEGTPNAQTPVSSAGSVGNAPMGQPANPESGGGDPAISAMIDQARISPETPPQGLPSGPINGDPAMQGAMERRMGQPVEEPNPLSGLPQDQQQPQQGAAWSGSDTILDQIIGSMSGPTGGDLPPNPEQGIGGVNRTAQPSILQRIMSGPEEGSPIQRLLQSGILQGNPQNQDFNQQQQNAQNYLPMGLRGR